MSDWFFQRGDISTRNGSSLKLVGKFTYLERSVSSTETDINMRQTKAWIAIDSLSIIRKSDLADKIKRSFFQAAIVSLLLYGCTTWTLSKRLEKKLHGNYTRMLRAILNTSWRHHPKSSSGTAITQECCEQSWTSPGGNTPQDINCTATCVLSRKLCKLNKPDMQDTAGEEETNS